MGPCLNKVEQPTTITPEDLELEDWFNKLREINRKNKLKKQTPGNLNDIAEQKSMENTLNSFNSLMSTTQKSFYNKKAKLAKTGSSLKSKEGNKISNVITLSKFTDTQSTMTFNPNSRKGMTRSPSCDDVSCRLSLDAN